MFNNIQFRALIINPVLESLKIYSGSLEELLVATMAHESLGGVYLAQLKGPALGIYQMEKATHDDIWKFYLPNQPILSHGLMQACKLSTMPDAEMMVYHLRYATAMAAIHYYRLSEEIRNGKPISIWATYKAYWNTPKGKTKEEDFNKNYNKFIGKPMEPAAKLVEPPALKSKGKSSK